MPMSNLLSKQGQELVDRLASRTGFSAEAVAHMLAAVQVGRGSMAQFSHPEFGGPGQWMRGGMLMIGDMFNTSLKGRVEALVCELAKAVADADASMEAAGGEGVGRGGSAFSFFTAGDSSTWYPADLGMPSSSGSQNVTRYAYFAEKRRLAVDVGHGVCVYDTLDHRIVGFGQQQDGAATMVFTSQHGLVSLSSLPIVSHTAP